MNQTVTPNFELARDLVRSLGLYNATLNVQENTPPAGPLGGPGTWANRTGLTAIPCIAAADIFMTRISQSEEIRRADKTTEEDKIQISLDGYYPTILKTNRVVVTSTHPVTAVTLVKTFEITGIEHASQLTFTRLAVREATL